jgi:hypothetical protein
VQISAFPFVTTGAYAKIGTMEAKTKTSTSSITELSVEQSQFDHAQREEVMDQQQHLAQMYEENQDREERMIVQSGNATRRSSEKADLKMKEEPSRFVPSEGMKAELSSVVLRGVKVHPHNAEMLTQLLRLSDSWLHLFGAVPICDATANVVEKNRVSLRYARSSLLKYAEDVLLALGMKVITVTEEATMGYSIDSMMDATQQLQEVVAAILEDWDQAAQTFQTQAPVSKISYHHATKAIGRGGYPTVATFAHRNNTSDDEGKRQPRTYVPVEAIPTFSRGSSSTAEAWLKKFLYVANQAGWDNKLRCETFDFKMEGHASYWFTALPSEVQKNWSRLVQAFKDNYSVGLQSPQERYWSATRDDKESAVEYLVRLNALGKRAGIDYHGLSAAEHVRRYLITVRDHKLSDRFLHLGITDIKTLEQRLKDLELGQKRIMDTSTKSADTHARCTQAYRAAPVRQVHWSDENPSTDQHYHGYPDDKEYYDHEDTWPSVYAADDKSRQPSPSNGGQRHRKDDRQDYRARYSQQPYQDWSQMECKDCGRIGHPTDRCLYRCKACRTIHREGDCRLVIAVRKLTTVLDGAPIPEEAKQLLKDLNC